MNNRCRRCTWPVKDQVFHADGYRYSIGRALEILKAAPRKPVTLPSGHLYEKLCRHEINVKHLAHVNVRYPVIAAPYEDSFLVIDGNHRAWMRLFKRLPIRAYLLTVEEVARIRTGKGK